MNIDIKKRTELFLRVLKKFPEFRYLGDPILRTPTQSVDITEGAEIGSRLGGILVKYRQIAGIGRGLAAPQIGISKSVFVTYLDDEIQTYINPKIISSSQSNNSYRELCLSCGTMWVDIKRPEIINLQWTNKAGGKQEKEFTGLVARLIQHEYDHLQGIPNFDKAEAGTIEFVTSDPLAQKLRSI